MNTDNNEIVKNIVKNAFFFFITVNLFYFDTIMLLIRAALLYNNVSRKNRKFLNWNFKLFIYNNYGDFYEELIRALEDELHPKCK